MTCSFFFFSFSGHWTKTVNNHYVIISLRNFWHTAAVAVATLCVISHNSFPRGLKVLGGLLSRPAQIRMLLPPPAPPPATGKAAELKTFRSSHSFSTHAHSSADSVCEQTVGKITRPSICLNPLVVQSAMSYLGLHMFVSEMLLMCRFRSAGLGGSQRASFFNIPPSVIVSVTSVYSSDVIWGLSEVQTLKRLPVFQHNLRSPC